MTELDLYKFITNNNIEYDVDDSCDVVTIFIPFYLLEEFNELLKPNYYDEGGIDCVLSYGYCNIEINDICDYFEIDINNVFK